MTTSLPTDYQNFIHLSKYSRWRNDLNRRETWIETIQRYIDFFQEYIIENHITSEENKKEFLEELEKTKNSIIDLEVVPSMRALKSAGLAFKKHSVAGYNCAFTVIDHPHAFDEILYLSCCGCGVGFSVEQKYISKLPEIPAEFYPTSTVIDVPDSKIGWASALRELISLLYAGKIPKWDVSKVRPYGSKLKTFGGTASGPRPLVDLFEFVVKTYLKAAGRKLESIECHDICCKIGLIAESGGTRRAALLSLSDIHDSEMRHAKSGNWWEVNSQRSYANNSAVYYVKPELGIFLEEWLALYRSKSGERGILSLSNLSKTGNKRRDWTKVAGVNPCLIGITPILTEDGYFKIGTLKDKKVNIWNGYEWSEVIPFSTGKNSVCDIHFSNGQNLTCTLYHEFILKDGQRIQAKDLAIGDKLQKWILPVIDNTSIIDSADVSIKSIIFLKEKQETFCLTEPKNHTFIANGIMVGNCGEILLRPNGFCNLSEVVVRPEDTQETLKSKIRIATFIGTMQSCLTKFKYIRKIWQKNAEEERLLGVSLTGILDNNLLVDLEKAPEILKNLKEESINTNLYWSKIFKINPSMAITTVKPSGNTSQLVNAASGIHPRFSPFYIRRVRNDNKDPLTQLMKDAGVPNEPCVMKPENTTIFSFPVKAPLNAIFRNAYNAIQQLELLKIFKQNWAEHNISITIYVKETEWLDVASWVYKNFDFIGGVAFLPYDGGSYKQAPYEEITETQYNEFLEKMPKNIEWSQITKYESEDMTVNSKELACTSGHCEI